MMKAWTDFPGSEGELKDLRHEMDEMLDKYPQTVISSKYYHEIITTGKMMGRRFGWNECPSVTESLDNRKPPAPPPDSFFPLGFRFKNSSSLLYIGHARLLHLQGWRGAHELGHGQQTGTYAIDQRFAKLD